MELMEGLLVAGAQSAGIAVLAILVFQAHRRVGVLPFLALLTLLAALVPLTAHHTVLEAGPLGALSLSQAILAPVVITLVVLVHLMRGWRNAQIMASVPAFAGALVALSVTMVSYTDLWVLSSALPQNAGIPLGVGLALAFGAAFASVSLLGLHRVLPGTPALVSVSSASFLGVLAQGVGISASGWAGALPAGSTLLGAFALPPTVGLGAVLVVTVYAAMQLANLWPQTRQALTAREPIGQRSQLDDAHALQKEYRLEREEEREQADTLKQLVEEADHGAYVCTPEGRITYANKGLSRLLDQPDRDLEGENVRHVFGGRDKQGRPRFAQFPVKPGRHRATIQLPSGRKRALEIAVQPASEGTLYGRVRDRTEEVLRAQVEEQKERAEFYVDLLRHDIGNYVMTPLSYLQVLERREDLPEDAQEYVEASRSAVEDIADLLGRIDVLSDVDNLDPEPVDAAQIMRSVAESAQHTHGGSLRIQDDLPAGPVPVSGSPLLEEVFGNLVGNAVRHAGEDALVELGAEKEGTDWVLWVADDGPGVPDEEKETIFDRTHHDESAGGKGLGLYIVKTIVEALNGEVWVGDRVPESPPEGASFKIRLPAVGLDELEDGVEDLAGTDTSEGVMAP